MGIDEAAKACALLRQFLLRAFLGLAQRRDLPGDLRGQRAGGLEHVVQLLAEPIALGQLA